MIPEGERLSNLAEEVTVALSKANLNVTLHGLAKRYAELAQQILGDHLVSMALYGSVARGQAGPRSDIDLFVMLADAPAGMFRRRALLEPVRERVTPELEALWSQGIYADFVEVIRTRQEALEFHPLYLDMSVDAKLLFDRDGFLEEILERVREKLQAMGAQRRALGTSWYWELKKEFKPGEVIQL